MPSSKAEQTAPSSATKEKQLLQELSARCTTLFSVDLWAGALSSSLNLGHIAVGASTESLWSAFLSK
ncbi:hypothetical protein AOLI_G00065640 [Acnodon oligacanthus]